MEPNSFKEEKNEVPEKNAPTTPKGKYDLRASTLVPRDYGTQLDPAEDEENGGKKKVEAVIDLTEDDDEVKGNKPGLKTPFSTDDSGMCTVRFSDVVTFSVPPFLPHPHPSVNNFKILVI